MVPTVSEFPPLPPRSLDAISPPLDSRAIPLRRQGVLRHLTYNSERTKQPANHLYTIPTPHSPLFVTRFYIHFHLSSYALLPPPLALVRGDDGVVDSRQ
jgi:hypothetical protein